MDRQERRRAPGAWARGPALAGPRRWLDERLGQGGQVAGILIGVSRLDLLNAAHGRRAGDTVMRAARERLAALVGERRVERLSGGRFLLTVDADHVRAFALAGGAAEALARPFAGGLVVGARTALALGVSGEDGGALLARLGEALKHARAGGAGAPVLAERGGTTSLDRLAVDLHHAIARGEIDILFQPQVRLSDGAIVGAEALARWGHPILGPLGAHELFAAAAWADLELPLSEHIQERALADAAAWPEALAALRLSINVTAGDVMRPGFADALLGRVQASGLAPERLSVELTEVDPIPDLPDAAASLGALRAAGCRIAIDDFGAGYSSLAYLKLLPVDMIKLDKSLIDDVAPGTRAARLVEGAVAIGRALDLTVIAEGVETEAQRAALAAAGCDLYQGFLCAPPVDSAALARLLEESTCAR
jgi:EAL domain-containing protein (putative c-di-GMP-specific phosphodiesterase class I)/GGDEF domain-containing protein